MNASPSPIPAPGTNLFVASLPPGTGDARLREMFRPFGRIVSAKVMVDLKTRTLRNHGFVRFESAEEAQAAIAGMHRRRPDDASQPIHVVVSTHKDEVAEGEECEVVYVRNLPEGVSAEALRKHFATFGDVNDVLIPPNSGAHQGVCFIRYASIDSARRAVTQAHNTTPFGPEKALQVRFKESRRESQKRGQKKTQRVGDAGGSGATSPHGSPHEMSLSSLMVSPNFLPLSVSPHNATMHSASSPPTMVLMPMGPSGGNQHSHSHNHGPSHGHSHGTSSPPGTGSPNYGTPISISLQGASAPQMAGHQFAPLMSSDNTVTSPQPQFSLAASQPFSLAASQQQHQHQHHHQHQQQSQQYQMQQQQQFSPGSQAILAPGQGIHGMQQQQQQQQHQSRQQQGSPVSRPFPGSNDLFFSNFCSQEWILDLVRPFQPTLVQPGPGTLIVRLRDESLHVVVAQSLNAMVGPTGMQLTAALVRM